MIILLLYDFMIIKARYMIRVVTEFYNFFINPSISSEKGIIQKWNVLLTLLILNFLIHLVHELINYILGLVYVHKMDVLTNSFDDIFPVLISAVFITPFLEEGMFRMYISKKNYFFAVFLLVVIGLLLSYDSPVMRFTYALYIVFIISLVIFRLFSKENPKWMIYGSSFFFSVFHIFNYNLVNFSLCDYFIIAFELVPHFIGGVILVYIRILFGLNFSIISHALWNFLILILFLMFY